MESSEVTELHVARHVALPLLTGIFIYLAWRPTSLLVFHCLDWVGLLEPVLALRNVVYPFGEHLPGWLLYSLPDGLWTYSFTSAILIAWSRERTPESLAWCSIPFVLGIGSEVGQFLSLVPGVFEVTDIFFYIAGIFWSLYILGNPDESKACLV